MNRLTELKISYSWKISISGSRRCDFFNNIDMEMNGILNYLSTAWSKYHDWTVLFKEQKQTSLSPIINWTKIEAFLCSIGIRKLKRSSSSTTHCSSSSWETFFSIKTNLPKSHKLSCEMFENRVVLKSNLNYNKN